MHIFEKDHNKNGNGLKMKQQTKTHRTVQEKNMNGDTSPRLKLMGVNAPIRQLQELLAALDNFALISKTDSHGVITYANKQFAKVSGYSIPELLGKPHSIIRSSHHSKEFFRTMWDTIKKGNPWKGEIQNKNKDEKPYWVYSLILPIIGSEGKPVEYFSVRFDITDLKEANERQAILLEKLNHSNQELADFSYHVAHDLKSPLHSIQAALQSVINDIQKPLPKDKRETLSIVINRIDKLEHLISQLLELARADIATDFNETVRVSDIVKDIIDLVKRPEKNLSFDVRLNSHELWGEKVKFHQLFQNLISNAVKFVDKSNGIIEIGAKKRGRNIIYYVKDNGPGIKKKDQARIFDLFVTRAPSTNENHNTGIGLATVKKIVTRYGGRVSVRSTYSKGATFMFTLPKAIPKNSLN
ncbi:MAG: Adaptive-response sensory-kinase SasA [Elusimicrobia bacterium]|nr:Adaptive-response sensory-kinase SasA [Elusimicrobiota bacterium]